MKRKKGQSAMEYLMTYGWAILIVIVVIAALFNMGVFTPGSTVPYSGFETSDITYVDHNAASLIMKVGPRTVTYSGTDYDTGQTFTVDISACTWANDECAVSVAYTVTESGLPHTVSGTLYQ